MTAIIFSSIYYASDEIVHAIFCAKYWVLSRKILQITNNKQDKNLSAKARFIFTIQMLLIISTTIVFLIGKY
jgi:hypothetical protein